MSNFKIDETTDNMLMDMGDGKLLSSNTQADPKDEDEEDMDDEQNDKKRTRQDMYYVFTNDKDLRHHETILIKASLYTGIAVRVKALSHYQMENLLLAVEQAGDNGIVNLQFEDCRLMKRAVIRIIEFCRTTQLLESLSLIKVTFDDG